MAVVWKEIGSGKFALEKVVTNLNYSSGKNSAITSMTFKNNGATEIEFTVGGGTFGCLVVVGGVTSADGTYTELARITQESSQKQEKVSLLDSAGKPYPYVKMSNQILNQTGSRTFTVEIM